MIKINIKHPIKTNNGTIYIEFDKEFNNNQIISIFGESGAGKSTILKIIAGLIKPENAFIQVDDEVWFDSEKNINLPPQKRNIGFLFQDYALFPNMSVYENLKYALNDKNQIQYFLDLMNLTKLSNAYPKELSGGQAQRVALARALIRKPKLLLLDEPLSAIDFKMRSSLQDELLKLFDKFKLSIFLISHDIAEIYKMSNVILHLDKGKIIKDMKANEFSSSNISAKIRLSAVLIDIKQSDVLVIFTLLLNQDLIKITITKFEFEQEYKDIKIGDTLIISTKAFNPMIIGKN